MPVAGIRLDQNHPNPFNLDTRISFTLAEDRHVLLEVYDVAGRHVSRLTDRRMGVGRHTELWDGRDSAGNRVASGIYFYRLSVGGESLTRKCVLLP